MRAVDVIESPRRAFGRLRNLHARSVTPRIHASQETHVETTRENIQGIHRASIIGRARRDDGAVVAFGHENKDTEEQGKADNDANGASYERNRASR